SAISKRSRHRAAGRPRCRAPAIRSCGSRAFQEPRRHSHSYCVSRNSVLCGSFVLVGLALDIDRLSFFKKGPDALVEFFRAAAQHLIAILHRDHGLDRSCSDATVTAFLVMA